MDTLEYAPGRLVDVSGTSDQRTVLLWHGQQANARAAVRPLAELLIGHGLGVVVPDWNSHADDGGRADLLRSVQFARQRVDDPNALVLVGWSMGGVAAAGLTLQAARVDVGFAHTVCLAGAFRVPDPIFGQLPATQLKRGTPSCSFTLLHGVSDDVIPLAVTCDFAEALRQNQWPVAVVELPADHGSIAGAHYDSAADRYAAADDPQTLAIAADVAARIAAASG
jgi:dienelactone hydrolase